MKFVLLLVGVQLVSSQYGPLPARKTARPILDSVNEIVPQDNPQDYGLNGLAPGINPLNKATNFWWAGPDSPFKPGADNVAPSQYPGQQPGDRPAAGCPPGGCGAPPSSCAPGQACTPSQLPGSLPSGSNPFLGQGYGPRPGGQQPAAGSPPSQVAGGPQLSPGTLPPSSSQPTKPVDISSNPFLSSALQKPVPSSPDSCNAQDTYCVPSHLCYNGIINDNEPNLQNKYQKGPCSGNYVCCNENKQVSGAGSTGQPGSQFPGNQPGSQYPGSQPGSQFPGGQPGSKFPGSQPGSQYPGSQPGSQFPGGQPGSQFPGGQPGSQFPGSQPGSQYPGSQPGSQFPGAQPGTHFPGGQPGSQQPGNQPGSQLPGSQPGSQYPSNRPGTKFPGSQPGAQYPGAQPGTQFPGGQPGSHFPGGQPGSNFPGGQPGSQFPGGQPGSQFPGGQPGSQFPGGQPGSQFPGSPSSYVTDTPINKYTGPLNTTPHPGCAAALKCVAEIYCTAEGVMSNTPVQLTREQLNNKVPLADCQDLDTGLIGKCCRDPNYKDPWPAGMMMAKGQGPFDDGSYKGDISQDFDNGQYRPEHQGSAQPGYQQQPTSLPGRTINKPLGVFNTNVTPFPAVAKPQPGQTHAQVFPQNEDRLVSGTGTQPGYAPGVGGVQPNFQNQGQQSSPGFFQQPGQPGQPDYTSPGQPGAAYPGSYPQGQPHSSQPGTPVSFHPGTHATGSTGVKNPQGHYNVQPAIIPSTPALTVQPGQPIPFIPSPGSPQQLPGQYTPYPSQPGSVGAHPIPQPAPSTIPQGGSPQQQPFPNTPSYGSTPGQKPFPPPFPGAASLTPHHTSPPQPSPQVIPGQECGVRRPPYSDSTENTQDGEFPWQAIVVSSSNRSALCSGAIISDNAILTSAHCLEGFEAKDLQVKVGTWKLNQPGKTQVSNVAAIVNHPSYDSGSLVKDQAVLALAQPLILDQTVDKVCLPPADNEHYTQDGKTCYVTGWGRPNLQAGLPGTPLHKVEVNLIPSNQCENTLKQTYLGKYFILNEGFTCAQPKSDGDFCKVDVGSPLVCDRGDGHYELVGVYSWDTQCSSQAPAVLTECDSQWTQQVLNTPIDTLKAQQNQPKFETSRPEDIDQKPGFALGYGK